MNWLMVGLHIVIDINAAELHLGKELHCHLKLCASSCHAVGLAFLTVHPFIHQCRVVVVFHSISISMTALPTIFP